MALVGLTIFCNINTITLKDGKLSFVLNSPIELGKQFPKNLSSIGFFIFLFALRLTPGARLPVLGPFHTGVVPSVPTLDMMPCYEL